jgi:hypothetical protein
LVLRTSCVFRLVFVCFEMSPRLEVEFEMSLKSMWNLQTRYTSLRAVTSHTRNCAAAVCFQLHLLLEAELHQLRCEGISKGFPPVVSEEVPQPLPQCCRMRHSRKKCVWICTLNEFHDTFLSPPFLDAKIAVKTDSHAGGSLLIGSILLDAAKNCSALHSAAAPHT